MQFPIFKKKKLVHISAMLVAWWSINLINDKLQVTPAIRNLISVSLQDIYRR